MNIRVAGWPNWSRRSCPSSRRGTRCRRRPWRRRLRLRSSPAPCRLGEQDLPVRRPYCKCQQDQTQACKERLADRDSIRSCWRGTARMRHALLLVERRTEPRLANSSFPTAIPFRAGERVHVQLCTVVQQRPMCGCTPVRRLYDTGEPMLILTTARQPCANGIADDRLEHGSDQPDLNAACRASPRTRAAGACIPFRSNARWENKTPARQCSHPASRPRPSF